VLGAAGVPAARAAVGASSGVVVPGRPAGDGEPRPDELAEADGNRTRLTEVLGHVGFRGRGGHQAP
jgi:hypothetical protein